MGRHILTFASLVMLTFVTGCFNESSFSSLFSSGQLVHAPESTDRKKITQLAYLESYDGVLDDDYAFVAYKEEYTRTGEWKLKIKGKKVADTSIKPEHPIIRQKISDAAQSGKDFFVMGFNIQPRNNDPRLVENRIYFNESLKPEYVEIHLVTRNRDGLPKAKKVAKFDWPEQQSNSEKKLLSAPESTATTEIEELAYISSYDVIANADYAYLAYKLTDKKSGKWVLKIAGKDTAGSSIDPERASLAKNIKKAAEQGKKYITTGFQITPGEGDPRMVEHRVYFDKSLEPSYVEMIVVTRKADGSANEKQIAKFAWPV